MRLINQITYWIRSEKGNRFVLGFFILSVAIVFSSWLAWKRESGPATEWVLTQGIIARELAKGNGYTTIAIDPYQVSKMPDTFVIDKEVGLPEMWHAPLYPYLLSGVFQLFGDGGMQWMFADPEISPSRSYPFFRADRVWLYFNLVLLLTGTIVLYFIGKWFWNPSTALLGIVAYLLSISTWLELIQLTEAFLIQLLIVGILICLYRLEKLPQVSSVFQRKPLIIAVSLGVLLAALFLCRYALGIYSLAILILAIVIYRTHPIRRNILLISAFVGMLVVLPWILRNVSISGNPLGYASELLNYRVGDSTAEPDQFRRVFDSAGAPFSIRKVLNKGLSGWKLLIEEEFWKGGGLIFSAFFLLSLIYPFKDVSIRRLRSIFFSSAFLFLLFEPFFASGEIETLGILYFSAPACLFGSAFLFVLLKSLSVDRHYYIKVSVSLILFLQALPLFKFALEPKRTPFHYPPYWPSVFVDVRTYKSTAYDDKSGIVADIPGGMCWYADVKTWAQPYAYEDFSELFLYQDIAIQFFSPALLDRPFLSELKYMGVDGKPNTNSRTWGQIYEGIVEGELPRHYPLRGLQPLSKNVYVTYLTR